MSQFFIFSMYFVFIQLLTLRSNYPDCSLTINGSLCSRNVYLRMKDARTVEFIKEDHFNVVNGVENSPVVLFL